MLRHNVVDLEAESSSSESDESLSSSESDSEASWIVDDESNESSESESEEEETVLKRKPKNKRNVVVSDDDEVEIVEESTKPRDKGTTRGSKKVTRQSKTTTKKGDQNKPRRLRKKNQEPIGQIEEPEVIEIQDESSSRRRDQLVTIFTHMSKKYGWFQKDSSTNITLQVLQSFNFISPCTEGVTRWNRNIRLFAVTCCISITSIDKCKT